MPLPRLQPIVRRRPAAATERFHNEPSAAGFAEVHLGTCTCLAIFYVLAVRVFALGTEGSGAIGHRSPMRNSLYWHVQTIARHRSKKIQSIGVMTGSFKVIQAIRKQLHMPMMKMISVFCITFDETFVFPC